ncbi:hypothetical protein RCL1_004992 [Eukaryota sp. TZLM3-RCL]
MENQHLNDSCTEVEVGISLFLSNGDPFSCVLRSRYSDFIVTELFNGKPVSLTPLPESELQVYTVNYQKFAEVCGPLAASEAEAFSQSVLEKTNTQDFIILSPSDKDIDFLLHPNPAAEKVYRREQHEAVRHFLPDCVTSDTHPVPFSHEGHEFTRKAIRIYTRAMITTQKGKRSNSSRQQSFDKRLGVWPTDRPQYLRFVLVKENTDTMSALRLLANYIGVKTSIFSTCGLKDKRAVTCQYVTAFKLPKDKLIKVNTMRMIRVSNFSYVPEPLKIGSHSGNRFTLVLKDLGAINQLRDVESIVSSSVENLKIRGFLNYFGLQRFGTSAVKTHVLGGYFLAGNFQGLVKYVLCTKSSHDPEIVQNARESLEKSFNQDTINQLISALLAQNSRHSKTLNYDSEVKILKKLREKPNDFCGSLANCPLFSSSLRSLYTHAFQSFVFNHLVSFRIEKYGADPIVGDLVFLNQSDVEGELYCDDEMIEDDSVESTVALSTIPQVVEISAENIHNYNLTDVVLPLIGSDVGVANIYVEKLNEILAPFGMTSDSVRHWQFPRGSYRKMAVKPTINDCRLVKYNDNSECLTTNPMIELKKELGQEVTEIVREEQNGDKNALIITFDLPSSSYATMFIRELSKQDSSRVEQFMTENRKRRCGGEGDEKVSRGE